MRLLYPEVFRNRVKQEYQDGPALAKSRLFILYCTYLYYIFNKKFENGLYRPYFKKHVATANPFNSSIPILIGLAIRHWGIDVARLQWKKQF